MLTVIGDVVKRFLRATKPPARVGAGMGAIVLQRLLRAVLWVNMYVAAGGGIATWVAGRFVALALVAVLMVTAHTVLRLVLMPFQHVALAIVGAAIALEVTLTGRVFVQLAYEDNVDGLAGTVLTATDPIVAPFRDLEGTAILHDTGVVEFATLTAMEAVLVGTIAAVVLLMFWSEFLHMYRRVRDFFAERSERRQARTEAAEDLQPTFVEATPAPIADMNAAAADLSAAS